MHYKEQSKTKIQPRNFKSASDLERPVKCEEEIE